MYIYIFFLLHLLLVFWLIYFSSFGGYNQYFSHDYYDFFWREREREREGEWGSTHTHTHTHHKHAKTPEDNMATHFMAPNIRQQRLANAKLTLTYDKYGKSTPPFLPPPPPPSFLLCYVFQSFPLNVFLHYLFYIVISLTSFTLRFLLLLFLLLLFLLIRSEQISDKTSKWRTEE